MSVFLPKNRSLPASYNYLRESKTDKSLEYTLKKKGFASDIFKWIFQTKELYQ